MREKINKAKVWVFKRTDKTDKLLVKTNQEKKKENTNHQY